MYITFRHFIEWSNFGGLFLPTSFIDSNSSKIHSKIYAVSFQQLESLTKGGRNLSNITFRMVGLMDEITFATLANINVIFNSIGNELFVQCSWIANWNSTSPKLQVGNSLNCPTPPTARNKHKTAEGTTKDINTFSRRYFIFVVFEFWRASSSQNATLKTTPGQGVPGKKQLRSFLVFFVGSGKNEQP